MPKLRVDCDKRERNKNEGLDLEKKRTTSNSF